MKKLLTGGLVATLLVGCANGYQQFYKAVPIATPELVARMRVAPPPATPVLERSPPGDWQQILDAYAKRGYSLLGSSSFNSGNSESDESAVAQGRTVGADLVLVMNPKYTGTVTSTVPITKPTTSTTYSSGMATAYGPSGTVTAYGTGSSTTYGSTTTYIPVAVNRNDYTAAYFVKQKFSFGAFFRDLDDSERREHQTNRGAVVRLIVDGTPAFTSDVLIGDIVLQIDGSPVSGAREINEIIRGRAGRPILLTILRRGTKIEKSVSLNP
jgi:PDZ domain